MFVIERGISLRDHIESVAIGSILAASADQSQKNVLYNDAKVRSTGGVELGVVTPPWSSTMEESVEEPDFPCAKIVGTVQLLLPKWLSMARFLKAWRLMGSAPKFLGIPWLVCMMFCRDPIPWLVKGLVEGHRVCFSKR